MSEIIPTRIAELEIEFSMAKKNIVRYGSIRQVLGVEQTIIASALYHLGECVDRIIKIEKERALKCLN